MCSKIQEVYVKYLVTIRDLYAKLLNNVLGRYKLLLNINECYLNRQDSAGQRSGMLYIISWQG